MATRIKWAQGIYDLSDVKTLEDLREEIAHLKKSIEKDEQELEDRLQKMPQETLKAVGDAVLPGFLSRMIANGSWKLLASGAGMLANPFSKKQSFTKVILSTAKKLGLIALVKGAYTFWRNRKTTDAQPAQPGPAKQTSAKTINKPK